MKSRMQNCRQQSILVLLSLYLSSTCSFVQSFTSSRASMCLFMKNNEQKNALGGVSPPPTAKAKNRKQYQRKRQKPMTEQLSDQLRQKRQADYNQMRANASGRPSIWSFESLFPDPVLDEDSIQRDLYGLSERDKKTSDKTVLSRGNITRGIIGKVRTIAGPGMMRIPTRLRDLGTQVPYFPPSEVQQLSVEEVINREINLPILGEFLPLKPIISDNIDLSPTSSAPNSTPIHVDVQMTRMVQDKLYGYRRTPSGDFQYDTSLMGDGAVQFRDGVRLGNALKVNADKLTYLAKKEMAKGRIEEAQDLYEQAFKLDPRDGRAYLGLSKCAERRRDFKLARQILQAGIANSVSTDNNGQPDRGANPFLLQALGCLEEKMGNVSEAEALFIAAARSRPSHAAAWVSLGQLRTRKLRQGAAAGRACYQTAERELKRAGLPPSSHVYTAWAALEHKKGGDLRRARELFQAALDVDPKCSVAWLQLGVMLTDKKEWEKAAKCFEAVLKFDKSNSRVLQCYAILETKRPEGNSRKAIELFERALKADPRDAGVLQAYALYVADLGDVEAARNLLRAGTNVNKRHAPVWQAWGVLETRYGTADDARDIFQQGIWACAQLAGSQSGGYACARLWQAWGVLEAREGNYMEARRCFSRALDADNRNVAATTAWTLMEEELGNVIDARSIFERALVQFAAGSDEKVSLWRAYELMEQRTNNSKAAQQVYQRSMRESMSSLQEEEVKNYESESRAKKEPEIDDILRKSKEVEIVRWGGDNTISSMKGEVWMNNGSIEGKVPASILKKTKKQRKTQE